eukprot:4830217-Prorocentrum_lima.AAC.1
MIVGKNCHILPGWKTSPVLLMLVHLGSFYLNTLWKKNTEIQNMKRSSCRWKPISTHVIG